MVEEFNADERDGGQKRVFDKQKKGWSVLKSLRSDPLCLDVIAMPGV